MAQHQTEFISIQEAREGWLIFYGFNYYRILSNGMMEEFAIDTDDCLLLIPTGQTKSPATWSGDAEVILRDASKLIPIGSNFRLP